MQFNVVTLCITILLILPLKASEERNINSKQIRQIPQLKQYCASRFLDAWNDKNISIEQLKNFAQKASNLPEELQKILIRTIEQKKATDLENIYNTQPLKLSDQCIAREKTTFTSGAISISPNLKYICYITPSEKLFNDTSTQPLYYLALIHLPSKTTQLEKTLTNIYNADDNYHTKFAKLLFTPDSTHIIFNCPTSDSASSSIYQYNIETKQTSKFADVKATRAVPMSLTRDMRYVVLCHTWKARRASGIFNRETRTFTPLEGINPSLSRCNTKVITNNYSQNESFCYDINGNLLSKFSCLSEAPISRTYASTIDYSSYSLQFFSKNTSIGQFHQTNFDLLYETLDNGKCKQLHSSGTFVYKHLATTFIENEELYRINTKVNNEFTCFNKTNTMDWQFSPNGIFILIQGSEKSKIDVEDNQYQPSTWTPNPYPYIYYTYRAITHRLKLYDILNVLIAEAKFKNEIQKLLENEKLHNLNT